MTIKIREISNNNDLFDLKATWEHLLSQSEHTVFSTWEWQTTWWKHFGKNKKPLVLLAQEDGETIGIAPFTYSILNVFGFHTRKISFIGAPNADYNDFILARNPAECIRKFLDYIYQSFGEEWDSIDLDDISDASTITEILGIDGNLKTVSSRVLHKCLYMKLPDNYDQLYNRLHPKLRQNLRRNMKNLTNDHSVEIEDYSNVDKVNQGMQILFDLHQRRWESEGERGAFAEPEIRDFNLDLAQNLIPKKWLSLMSMNVDGVPAACSYGFRYNKKFYYYLHGVNPDFNRYSVGNLMMASVIKKSIADQLSEVDLLRGDEPFKYRWSDSVRNNYNFVITKNRSSSKMRSWFLRKYAYYAKRLATGLRID